MKDDDMILLWYDVLIWWWKSLKISVRSNFIFCKQVKEYKAIQNNVLLFWMIVKGKMAVVVMVFYGGGFAAVKITTLFYRS